MRTLFVIFCLINALSGPVMAAIDSGLIAYYPFNGDATDKAGNYNGKAFNGATFVTAGKIGGSLLLDGVDDYVSTQTASLVTTDSVNAISLWIKTDRPGHSHILTNRGWDYSAHLMIREGGNEIRYYMHDGSISDYYAGTTSLPDDKWHHVLVQKNGKNIEIYIDGTSEGTSKLLNVGNCDDDAFLEIGRTARTPAENQFKGNIDELKIYNRLLTSAEIERLARAENVAGDIDKDGILTPEDSLLALKVITSATPPVPVYADSDVNNDQRLGLAEAMYVLKQLANSSFIPIPQQLSVVRYPDGSLQKIVSYERFNFGEVITSVSSNIENQIDVSVDFLGKGDTSLSLIFITENQSILATDEGTKEAMRVVFSPIEGGYTIFIPKTLMSSWNSSEVSITQQGISVPKEQLEVLDDDPLIFWKIRVDCNGIPDGTAYYDSCGLCDSDPNNDCSIETVTSAGQVWMDRNLGASRVATSMTDFEAYGDLYQWGRGSDGHEKLDSPKTSTLSTTDTPAHGSFILATSTPFDWRTPQNHDLWQGESGMNNPCPNGFRIPTETDFEIQRASWSSNDAAGAFSSPLKLVVAGERTHNMGLVSISFNNGNYWSSTVNGSYSRNLYLNTGSASMNNAYPASGFSVRCIKDTLDPEVCDSSHLNLCTAEGSCLPAGGYWYNNICNSSPEGEYGTVTSAGQIWMDRNLGASRVAINSTDAEAYGDLYQWGRGTDGHEKRTSPTISTLSTTDVPGHGSFITDSSSSLDWRTPQNDNLWQGVYGTNNPCPSNFRLPTHTELEIERVSWNSNNNNWVGAFNSPLKIVRAGYRLAEDGTLNSATYGAYWSSTTFHSSSRDQSNYLSFGTGFAIINSGDRVFGRSVRCIMD